MLAGTGYTVEGSKQLLRTLRKAGVDLAELKPVHKEAADIVMRRAAQMAPRRTGLLASTIRTSATKTAGIIRAGNRRGNGGVPYAAAIHWGWLRRGIRPNPFVSRAAQATEATWFPLYENFTDRILNNVKGI